MVAARVADGDVDGDVDAPPDVSRRLPATTVTWPSRRRAFGQLLLVMWMPSIAYACDT